MYVVPFLWVADKYLRYNPFFTCYGKIPLLHQTEIVAKSMFLKPTRILIADVIGLGKTITALRILKTIDNYGKLSRILIVVPSVLIDQWIDEMKSMGVNPQIIERKTLDFFAQFSELPAGWYIGSMDTLKRTEYMVLLKRSRWDAIVVDEAHKLGIVGREPNLRWQSLGELIMENKEAALLLLSATPHRGKANDYLSRLALIDPTLLEVTNVGALEKVFDRPEFYRRTHNIVVFRRSKGDVNKIYENREVFKPCNVLAVLIEPSKTEKTLLRTITQLATSYLSRYYSYIVENFGWKTGRAQSIVALLRTLVIKRGLSSPQSVVKTFSKLIEKRGKLIELLEKGYSPDEAHEKVAEDLERFSRKLDELLTGDIGEHDEELDMLFDNLTPYFSDFLVEGFEEELNKAVKCAKRILSGEEQDSKLETLKRLLKVICGTESSTLPEDFKDLASGKIIIFTEFKDTAYYLYDRLKIWAERQFGERDIVRIFTSDNRADIEKIKGWLSGEGRKILVTTDVAGEGLNLQYANVLVNYEIAWSPVRLEQRIGRVWRYGQDKTTYVFNMFLADALEKEVAEVVFAKLYGISISLGKLEPIVGEKVFISTIRNELLEHAVEEETPVGGLVPIEIEIRGRKLSLSEMRIIDLIARDAKAFVVAFVNALKRLISEIRGKEVYPPSVEVEKVRRELKHLAGFKDSKDAAEATKVLLHSLAEILDVDIKDRGERIIFKFKDGRIMEFSYNSPEGILGKVVKHLGGSGYANYFIYQGFEKDVLLLSEVEILVDGEVRYKEPIGIAANVDTGSIDIFRGKALIVKISDLLSKAIPVDEIYGLDDVFSLIPEIVNASRNTFYEREAKEGVVKIVEAIREYEDMKKRLRGFEFFKVRDPQIDVGKPVFVFLSSAFLPEAGEVISEEVWDWVEEEAMPIVFNYEGLGGREAVRVSKFEHFDVKSVKKNFDGNIVEERYIEVKTKIRRNLSVKLTKEEANVAREKGDKYWLYIVYGVKTDKPVILAIRDPLNRLPLRKYTHKVEEESYVLAL